MVNRVDPEGLSPLTDSIGMAFGDLGVLFGGDKPQAHTDSRAGNVYVIEYANNPILTWFDVQGITIGNIICYSIDPDNEPEVRAHELAHSRQYAVLGDAYLPAHISAQVQSFITTGTYAKGNPLEIGPYAPDHTMWPWGEEW